MSKKDYIMSAPNFGSFLWAGFECTYALAENKRRFDLLAASKHDERVGEDYQLIQESLGIKTVREGLSWSQIDRGEGAYDFSRFEPMMAAAQAYGIQQIWDLNHFDFPQYLDPFADQYVFQYGEYAKRVVDKLRHYHKDTLYIVPLNEPSFFSWMCDNGLWAPYGKGKGTKFKKQIVKAAIRAMDAIWEVDKNVIFIHTDPYMYRQPMRVRSKEEQFFCQNFNENVKYHSWDMIAGKRNPELGGNPKYLQILGINYYFYNQQYVGIDKHDKSKFYFRSLSLTHKKRLPLTSIVKELYARYSAPMVIAETGSYRNRRPGWWKYILSEVHNVQSANLPLYGVCSYPTLDIMQGAGFIVPKSGLWDFDQKKKSYERIPHEETINILRNFNYD